MPTAPVKMQRLTEILLDQYGRNDEAETDFSSVPVDVALRSDDLVCGYASDALLGWPEVRQH